mgnify:CR=1 FL=1
MVQEDYKSLSFGFIVDQNGSINQYFWLKVFKPFRSPHKPREEKNIEPQMLSLIIISSYIALKLLTKIL